MFVSIQPELKKEVFKEASKLQEKTGFGSDLREKTWIRIRPNLRLTYFFFYMKNNMIKILLLYHQ